LRFLVATFLRATGVFAGDFLVGGRLTVDFFFAGAVGRVEAPVVAGGLDDLAAGSVAFHAHVGDDHLVFAQFNFGASLARAGGRVHIKSADFEDGFEGQQNSYFIIDK